MSANWVTTGITKPDSYDWVVEFKNKAFGFHRTSPYNVKASSDLLTWTTKVSSSGIGAAGYNPIVFTYVVGITTYKYLILPAWGSNLYYSADGDVWNSITLSYAYCCNFIIHKGTLYVAGVTSSGISAFETIPNEINICAYTDIDPVYKTPISLLYGRFFTNLGDYLYIRLHSNFNFKIFRSTNGASWQEVLNHTAASQEYTDEFITFNGALYLMDLDGRYLTSTDGTTWTEGSFLAGYTQGETANALTTIVFNSCLYVCDGSDIYKTSDGTTWERNYSLLATEDQHCAFFEFNGLLYALFNQHFYVNVETIIPPGSGEDPGGGGDPADDGGFPDGGGSDVIPTSTVLKKLPLYTLLALGYHTYKFDDETRHVDRHTPGYALDVHITSELVTRDFYGENLLLDERIERFISEVYCIASNTTPKVKVENAQNYSLITFKDDFLLELPTSYDEIFYNVDLVGRHARLHFSSTSKWSFRWLLPYFVQQEITND